MAFFLTGDYYLLVPVTTIHTICYIYMANRIRSLDIVDIFGLEEEIYKTIAVLLTVGVAYIGLLIPLDLGILNGKHWDFILTIDFLAALALWFYFRLA